MDGWIVALARDAYLIAWFATILLLRGVLVHMCRPYNVSLITVAARHHPSAEESTLGKVGKTDWLLLCF